MNHLSARTVASVGFLVLFFQSQSSAGGSEIAGFRYVTCEAKKCISVEAPKAWVSQSNGSFVASGDSSSGKNASATKIAVMRILDDGKVIHEFRGNEIVSQPEIDSITVESDASVILIGIRNSTVEVIDKRGRQ